jgi:hypothetical protein
MKREAILKALNACDRKTPVSRLKRLAREFRTEANRLKKFLVYEDGVCIFDGYAHSEEEAEQMYRTKFGVNGEGSFHIEMH